jgi:hypothetical protein
MQIDTGGYEHPTPWNDSLWRDEALQWISTSAGTRGFATRLADASVRLRPWSVIIRVPTLDAGSIWFKANPPSSAFEPRLMHALSVWTPTHVLRPLAIDIERAWSLMPDGGSLLTPSGEDRGGYWHKPIREYADLQRGSAEHIGLMLGMGVPDLRPPRLSDAFDHLMERVSGVDGMAEIAALRPQIVEWCEELGSSQIPAALDHSDLHDWQVFVSARGTVRFFDWGDASIAHPFTSLLVNARTLTERYGPEAAARVRDAYLEIWSEHGDLDRLRRLVHIACRLGPIGRAMTWERIFPAGRDSAPHDNVVGWLRVLAATPPI